MTFKIGTLAMALSLATSPLAFAETADEAAIKSIVESVGTLADTHNFDALEKLYADEALIDYSSLSGAPAEIKSPKGLMTEWASVLPGFDQTRHSLSDVSAVVDGAQATATAKVEAGHWIGDDYWQVDGNYAYGFKREDDAWKITRMTFTLENEVGSRDVFGPAIEAAKSHPTDYILRRQTHNTVMTFLTALEDKNMEILNSVWADDAVQDMPYVPTGWDNKVVGKAALIAQYAAWPEVSGNAQFTDGIIFYPMQDPRTVFVEYRGEVDIVPAGRVYRQKYGGLFHVENGTITLFREYFDPREFERAFGK